MYALQFNPTLSHAGNVYNFSILQIHATKAATKAEKGKLSIPSSEVPSNPNTFTLLTWQTGVSEFSGQKTALEEIEKWRASQESISIKFISGSGGIGKSRLASEACLIARKQKWNAGFLDPTTQQQVHFSEHGTLITIDYPEENIDFVKQFLGYLGNIEKQTAKIRILFLSRIPIGYWRSLISEVRAHRLFDEKPVPIESLNIDESYTIFSTAFEYASEFSETASACPSIEAFSYFYKQNEQNMTPLLVVSSAVLNALEPSYEIRFLSSKEVICALCEREKTRITNVSKEQHATSKLVVLTLCGATLTDGINVETLRKLDIIEESNEFNFIIETLILCGYLHFDSIISIKPDIVGACFLELCPEINENVEGQIWQIIDTYGQNTKQNCMPIINRIAGDIRVGLGINEPIIVKVLVNAVKNDITKAKVAEPFFTSNQMPIHLSAVDEAIWETLTLNTKDRNMLALRLNNLASAYIEREKFDKALNIAGKALDLNKKLKRKGNPNSEAEIAINYFNIAYAYYGLKNQKKCRANCKLSIQTFGEQYSLNENQVQIFANAHHLQGLSYRRDSYFSKAKNEFESAISLFENLPKGDYMEHLPTLYVIKCDLAVINISINDEIGHNLESVEEELQNVLLLRDTYPSFFDSTALYILMILSENYFSYKYFDDALNYASQGAEIAERMTGFSVRINSMYVALMCIKSICLLNTSKEYSYSILEKIGVFLTTHSVEDQANRYFYLAKSIYAGES